MHVLQAVCLGIGANVLLVGGASGTPGPAEGSQEAMAGLVAAGALLAAGSVPKLLLGGLAAAAGPSALGAVLRAATMLAGLGVVGAAAGPLFARFSWPGALPAPGPLPPSWTPPQRGSGYVRSLLAGAPAVPALPPPRS